MNEKIKVLVVDDKQINRAILRKILADEYFVLEAENGKVALDLIENTEGISAVLLDMKMPVMDGYEFLEIIRKNDKYTSLPVLAVTAATDEDSELRALRLGVDDFLEKPISPQVVLRRLKNATRLQQALYDSQIDSLTKLFNRGAFWRRIDTWMHGVDDGRKAALCVIDIDDFKNANDTLGHVFGDSVLTEFAHSLNEISGEKTIVSRLGGDEFAVFIKDYESLEKVKLIACKILDGLLNRVISQMEATPTCSVGIALFPEDSTNRRELYYKADQALYESKRLGENQYTFFGDCGMLTRRESKASKEWLLDEQDAYIYICDAETHQVYYANAMALGLIHTRENEGLNCFCHMIGLCDVPHGFCMAKELNGVTSSTHILISKKTGKKLLYKGKLVNWNNRMARMSIVSEME